jgi:hypothetical protein
MSKAKRKRGRPKGSGGRDDDAPLRRIVAHMVAAPAMKRAAAIRLVCGSIGESDSHRLYRKLRTQGKALRAEELERVRQNQTQATEALAAVAILRLRAVVGMGVMRAPDSPFIKAMRETQARVREMENSPMVKAMREAQARVREMENSPMAKVMRDAQARVREMENSPMAKALRGIAL